MAYLVVKWHGEEVHRAPLTGAMTIGREIGVDLWINDPALSRQHCRIEPSPDGRWRVVDLNSRNGVYVAEAPVQRHELNDGDVFRIGDAKLMFHGGEFQKRRAASPEEAMFASRMQPAIKREMVHSTPPLAATTTRVAEKPLTPSRVSVGPTPGQPLVKPFGTAFRRAPAQPKFEGKPTVDEASIGNSRGWVSSWLGSLRSRLTGKRDAA